jgi:hypothetical protein
MPNPLGSDSGVNRPHGDDWPLGTLQRHLRHAGAVAMAGCRRRHVLFPAEPVMFPWDGFWPSDARFK